ncbi:SIS domain-containing protein [Maritimibacter sp. DP1N21-5]|uniref:KpsF/GutQ family sugar-phosphate isomerase n=1 Tax=Maritimibacter sp. DP1N21-5 TaxID=2836867 RepID=UPI001C437F5E|nr:KpsF/GutQ family sugar-phosphate isomerase [Maritimibacter sp. DP1N21-5]MBV7408224.1 KpsF/GutQ family sugar-phosphate isomerase [Maritimibacter sp. DP1N21-5]
MIVLTAEEVLAELRRVLAVEAEAITTLASDLGADHVRAISLLGSITGRVIVAGVGKSGHIARKIAATLASTGTPAQFVHPTEASHGDLGMVTPADACIVISNSGETTELADLVTYARRFAIPLIAITSRADSTLAREADVVLTLPDVPEACPLGIVPTTSTTATLALGDALAVALMNARGFGTEEFEVFHPGGKLGTRLKRVEALMHRGEALPLLAPDTSMREGLITMTTKGFGLAGVVEDGRLTGIITDGDLRRNLDDLLTRTAGEVATRAPKTVPMGTLVSEALHLMNDRKISALFVLDDEGRIMGLIHIHDCLRLGLG